MYWFFIALGVPFLWALTNISDQYLVDKYSTREHSSAGLVIFWSLIAILTAIIIGIFTAGIFEIPILDKLFLLIVGGITVAWGILYLFALEISDVSSVIPWFLTVPIFGFILGYIFLHETFSLRQFIGTMVVLLGVFIVSVDFSAQKKQFKWKPAFYMLCACFLITAAGVIFKYVTIGNSFWISSFWEYVGFGISGIFLYLFIPKYRREFMAMIKKGGKRILALSTITETLTISGNLLNNFAILLAPVAMVYLVVSFQPAILLCLTLLATKFFPKIVKENMSKKALIPKIIAIGIMIVGSGILFS